MSALPELIAHRGAPRERIENTLPSFAAALAHGVGGIELDVRFTRDGVPVVHHDDALAPTATRHGGRRIDTLDAAELRGVELGPGVGVPALADVCDLMAGIATLYIEIKDRAADRDLAVVHATVRAATRGSLGRFAPHAFDHDLVRRSHALAPDIATGILREHEVVDPVAALRRAQARDLWQHWTGIDSVLVATVHGFGGRVIAWTVNDADVARRLASWGVDGLCTDDVPLIRAALNPTEHVAVSSTRMRGAP